MVDVEVKIKEDMKKLGCNCDKKIVLAYYLYIYLVDQKLMYDTEYCYNKDVDTLYVVARPRKHEKLNIYVPIPTSVDVSMDLISVLQENLCTVETGPSVNLAFIEQDLTIVIYTFTKGIAERRPAEAIEQVRQRAQRRIYINSELKKNQSQILNDTLNGGFVEDDDCQILD